MGTVLVVEAEEKNMFEYVYFIASVVWDVCPDNKKYEIGFKLDHFDVNLDEESLSLGNSFLENCNGLTYRSEGTKSRVNISQHDIGKSLSPLFFKIDGRTIYFNNCVNSQKNNKKTAPIFDAVHRNTSK